MRGTEEPRARSDPTLRQANSRHREHDLYLFFKRAASDEIDHREQIAAMVIDQGVAAAS